MKLYIKILIHSIFWIVFLSFTVAITFNIEDTMPLDDKSPHIIINSIWAATVFYLFYIYFIKYFEQGKFLKYLLFSILLSFVITIVYIPLHKLFYPQFELFNIRSFGPPIVGTFILA